MTRTLHLISIGDDDIYRHMTLWLDREHVDIHWQPPPPRNITHEMYYYTKYGSLPFERDGEIRNVHCADIVKVFALKNTQIA